MSTATAPRSLALLERVFEAPALAAEYPLVFGDGHPGETVELVEDGAPQAACTVLVREFHANGLRLRGGLIGSVATAPELRGRGLGTRLLERAEAALRARGCLFSLLWADEPRFYLERGYVPFGCEDDALLVPDLVPLLPAATGVRELRPGDVPHLHRLHARHAARVERSVSEMEALLAVPGMLTLVRERSAAPTHPVQPVAYACLGRGRDLADTIHDWGGDCDDVLALLAAHLQRRFPAGKSGALVLLANPSAVELTYRLAKLGAVQKAGILGLGKLLDPSGAAAALDAHFQAARVPGSATWSGDALVLTGPRGSARLDLDGTHALLFGGPEVRPAIVELLGRLGLDRARLPLELFAFGLDSI